MWTSAILDPNIAFVLLIAGAALIYWEVHAPGMIAPGLFGVLLVAASAYDLWLDSPSWYGSLLLILALVLLTVEFKYYTHMISGLAGTLLLAFGAMALVNGPRRITPELAIAASFAFGAITIFLGLLGMRARRSKPMNGLEAMVGEIGMSHTVIAPQGTVLIRGEYWQAVSDNSIAAGQRVKVDKVHELLLHVHQL